MLPLISVIMATYNRSNILPYAIRCVLNQTVSDWELLVVGDACTDDTEAVVRQFNDPRIQFINLPTNIGEQSGPNNVGLQRTRGQYVAFLNHDDLWFPDHLATALETLTTQQADMALGLGAFIQPDQSLTIVGLFANNEYRPNDFVPASGWVFRRTVLQVIPGWRSYRTLWLYPSHDFLRRVYRAGLKIVPTNRFTYVLIPSGNRTNSYRNRQSSEHEHYFDRLMNQPNWRVELLTQALASSEHAFKQRTWPVVWQGLKNVLKLPLIRRGIVTLEWSLMLHHPRKGDALQALRTVRGLPKL